MKRRGSSFGTATDWRLGGRGVGDSALVASRIFSFPYSPDQLWGLPNLLSNCYRGNLFKLVKRPDREADDSRLTSAIMNKTWSPYFYSPIRLHGVVLN
jgi:hypothetical protein